MPPYPLYSPSLALSRSVCQSLPHRGANRDELLRRQKCHTQRKYKNINVLAVCLLHKCSCRLPLLSVQQELVYRCHTKGQPLTSSCAHKRVGDKTGRYNLATFLLSVFCRGLSIAARQKGSNRPALTQKELEARRKHAHTHARTHTYTHTMKN